MGLGDMESEEMMPVDPLSLTTVPLEQYYNVTRLGQGTGFIWRRGSQFFLVTCWHVLSGRDFFTDENLDKQHGGRPNNLRTLLNTGTGFFDRRRWDITIWDQDNRPLWLVHPDEPVDVAVLPLPAPPGSDTAAYPINDCAPGGRQGVVGESPIR